MPGRPILMNGRLVECLLRVWEVLGSNPPEAESYQRL